MKLPQPKGHITTWGQKVSYWSYAIGMIFYYTIVGSYFNTYLIMQGIPLPTIGVVFLIVKIWDAVNDPLFAYIFDKFKFTGKRKERCLPWMRLACLLMPLASMAAFNMPGQMSMAGKIAWFAGTYVFWDMGYTICDVPFFAISTTMTTNMDERNFLFSWARVFHGAGTLFTTTLMTLMVGELVNFSFGKAAVITCGIAFVFTLPICFFGREKYAVEPDAPQKQKFTVKQMFTYLKANKYLTLMYACQILSSTFAISAAVGMLGAYYIYGSVSWTVIQTWLNMIPGAFNTAISAFVTSLTTFVVYEVDTLSELDALPPQPEGALDQIWAIGAIPLFFTAITVVLLLRFYKLRSRDAAVMARYNAGEITREECDAQLSRVY